MRKSWHSGRKHMDTRDGNELTEGRQLPLSARFLFLCPSLQLGLFFIFTFYELAKRTQAKIIFLAKSKSFYRLIELF